MDQLPGRLKIVVVGPCASGKSTLAGGLRRAGYDAHACAQEHSYVPEMWRMTAPNLMVYLDVSMETISRRRAVAWGAERLAAERARLEHARQHCDLYLPTDDLTREQVLERVERFIKDRAPRRTPPPGG